MTLSNRDKVRLTIGDTDVDPDADALLSDDEIDSFLAERSILDSDGGTVSVNVVAAAADCAGAVAAKYARQFDFAEDGQSFSASQRVGHYQALEMKLRNRSGGYSQPISLAGTATT